MSLRWARCAPEWKSATRSGVQAAADEYSLFLDMALVITGPLAGLLAAQAGFGAIYLLACVAALVAACMSLLLARRRSALPR